MAKFQVIEQHRSNYPNPISFDAGDEVVPTGKRDEEFPGWIWIRTSDGNEGWAPEQYFRSGDDTTAIAIADYSARELNTEVGETLESHDELNGWLWCRNAAGEEGWIPARTARQTER